jgi:hypothetical protein
MPKSSPEAPLDDDRISRLYNDPLAVYLRSELARADERKATVLREGQVRQQREQETARQVAHLMDETYIDLAYRHLLV